MTKKNQKLSAWVGLPSLLISLFFLHPQLTLASNTCFTINSVVDHTTYMTVNWTLNTKANCNSGNTYGFVFSKNSGNIPFNNMGNAGHYTSLNKTQSGNPNYPDTVWSKQSGGSCNANLDAYSGYTDGTTYNTDLNYLMDASGNELVYSGNATIGTNLYMHIESSGAGCIPNTDTGADTAVYTVQSASTVSAVSLSLSAQGYDAITGLAQKTYTIVATSTTQNSNTHALVFMQDIVYPSGSEQREIAGYWDYTAQFGAWNGSPNSYATSTIQTLKNFSINGSYSVSIHLVDLNTQTDLAQSATSTFSIVNAPSSTSGIGLPVNSDLFSFSTTTATTTNAQIQNSFGNLVNQLRTKAPFVYMYSVYSIYQQLSATTSPTAFPKLRLTIIGSNSYMPALALDVFSTTTVSYFVGSDNIALFRLLTVYAIWIEFSWLVFRKVKNLV